MSADPRVNEMVKLVKFTGYKSHCIYSLMNQRSFLHTVVTSEHSNMMIGMFFYPKQGAASWPKYEGSVILLHCFWRSVSIKVAKFKFSPVGSLLVSLSLVFTSRSAT